MTVLKINDRQKFFGHRAEPAINSRDLETSRFTTKALHQNRALATQGLGQQTIQEASARVLEKERKARSYIG